MKCDCGKDLDAAEAVPRIAAQYGDSIIVSRWIGCWVDYAVCGSCLLAADWFLGSELYQKMIPIWLALVMSYFVVLESLWGRTLGKLLTGTVVVDDKGSRPNFGQVVVRTIFRVIEVNPGFAGGVPAGIVAIKSKRKQRIGDMVANTYVILMEDLRDLQTAQSNEQRTVNVQEPPSSR
jgi:uncharacterized RDD family membrane protein YckC